MSDRLNLREFQQDLAERLSQAERGEVPRGWLAVESGQDRWLLDLTDAGEVVPVPPLAAVPLTRPWYAGLANVRGKLFSVVDLAAFHGGAPTARDADCRLLLVGVRHGINSALLVSRVHGLMSPDALTLEQESGAAPPWRGAAYRDTPGVCWICLNVSQLLKAREFLDIGT